MKIDLYSNSNRMYTGVSIDADNELKKILSITKLFLKGMSFISISTASLARGFSLGRAADDGLYAATRLREVIDN